MGRQTNISPLKYAIKEDDKMTVALTRIPGIGPGTAKVLLEKGFKSADQIAQTTIEQLVSVPGFSTARASKTIEAATELLAASTDAAKSAKPAAPRKPRTAKKPIPKSPASTTADNKPVETEIKKLTAKEQEKLEKATAKKAAKKEKAAKKVAKKAAAKAKEAKKTAKKVAKKAAKKAAAKAKAASKAAKKSKK